MTKFDEQVRGQHTGTTPGLSNDPNYASWISSYGFSLDDTADDPTEQLCETYATILRTGPVVTVGADIITVCSSLATSTALPAFAPNTTIGGHHDFILCFDGPAGDSPWLETTPGTTTERQQLTHLAITGGRCIGLSEIPAINTLPTELTGAARHLPPLRIEGNAKAYVKELSVSDARRYISEAADTTTQDTPDASRVATAVLYAVHAGLVEVTENTVMAGYGTKTAYALTPPQ